MNFLDIYKKIRSIDEDVPANPVAGSTPAPTAPPSPEQLAAWTNGQNPPTTWNKNTTTGKYEPPVGSPTAPQATAPAAPANPNSVTNPTPEQLAAWTNGQNPPTTWNKNTTTGKYEPPAVAPTTNGPVTHGPLTFGQKPPQQPAQMEAASALGLNECGDMMPNSPPQQQDNVDMNVTLHGSGPGGIRDLMSILRDIEGKDSNGGTSVDPQADDLEIMVGDMEEEYGNSAPDASGPQTASIQDVTNVGTTTNGGDHTRNRQAGLPQANAHAMHEAVVDRLSQLYAEIKQH
jgi:hypothetical protein